MTRRYRPSVPEAAQILELFYVATTANNGDAVVTLTPRVVRFIAATYGEPEATTAARLSKKLELEQ